MQICAPASKYTHFTWGLACAPQHQKTHVSHRDLCALHQNT
jgi:hypothetical protein